AHTGTVVTGLWLAERLHHGDADDRGIDSAGRAVAAGIARGDRPRPAGCHGRGVNSAANRQSVRRGDRRSDPRHAVAGLLAAGAELRHLRLFDQRADWHAPDRILRRSRLLAVRRRGNPGIAWRIQPDRLYHLWLADRPLQSPHPTVLDLRAARAVVAAAALHQFRH